MCCIYDIRFINLFFLIILKVVAALLRNAGGYGKPHKFIYPPHLSCIPQGKVLICSNQNGALSGKRIQIQGHCGS